MTCSFLVVNGPNLGCLGKRQPEIYGTQGLDALPGIVETYLAQQHIKEKITLNYYQSNHEGQIIDKLEDIHAQGIDGIILNAGALSHTSLALADCLAWIRIPFVEVHISNIFARKEEMRHASIISPLALGIIAGFGLLGYALAVSALYEKIILKE